MTVSAIDTFVRAAGNGVATVFNFAFRVFDGTDLIVRDVIDATQVSTILILDINYQVFASATGEGGSVQLTTALPTGHTLDIRSVIPLQQPEDIRNQGRFLPELHEGIADRNARQIQDTRRVADASIRIPDGELLQANWDTLLSNQTRKGKYLGYFNPDTGDLELFNSIGATVLSQSVIGSFLDGNFLGSFIFKRTDAEITAAITPVNYAYPPGDIRRYGAIGDNSTNCTPAIQAALNQYASAGAGVYIPEGIFNIISGFTITTRVVIRGAGKFKAVIWAVGFGIDVSMFTFTGTGPAPIADCIVEGFALYSDNNQARGITATYVTKSDFNNLYFYQLYNGYVGDHSFSNNYKNISTFAISQITYILGAECNNLHFDRCEARSTNSHGVLINGNVAEILFSNCDFEGFLTLLKAALEIAPPTGKTAIGIVLQSCYFEGIAGYCIETAGADASSVRGLVVKGCQFYGGFASIASVAGKPQYAIVLANVDGFDISENIFIDWQLAAFFRSGTELNGQVSRNTTFIPAGSGAALVPALTNSANAFSVSVKAENNFAGQKVVWNAGAPSTGTFGVRDISWETVPLAGGPVGYICVTAGTPGTWTPFGVSALEGVATYDPPSLADAAGATTTVTVTGAALGDYTQISFSLDLQGISVTAWVSAANTVSVRFQNESGGTLDLASGSLRARVTKHT